MEPITLLGWGFFLPKRGPWVRGSGRGAVLGVPSLQTLPQHLLSGERVPGPPTPTGLPRGHSHACWWVGVSARV